MSHLLTLHDPAAARRHYLTSVWQTDTMYSLAQRHAEERTERRLERPDFQEAFPRPLKNVVIAFRALRIVALDIDHMPSPDQIGPRCQITGTRRHQPRSLRKRSRSLCRWTLPVAVRGSSATISNRRGSL